MSDAVPGPLEIDVQRGDDRTLVTLSGELDASTATLLYDQLSDLEVEDVQHVVLDLAQVSFMDSTGLSVIVTEHKRLRHTGGGLTIFAPPSSVRRLFEITGLDAVLDIVPVNEER
jgi:anti-sigma B factor antagonist